MTKLAIIMRQHLIMPTLGTSLKTLALAALVMTGGKVCAQDEQWYGGTKSGFWGLTDSVGVRGAMPGPFNPPGKNPESLNALRQYGGYRISSGFAIEGSQTQFSSNSSACNGDPTDTRSCNGAAWSLSGVATLPFQSGLSLHGKLGLHYWQRGFQDDASHRNNIDEPAGIGKVYGIGLTYGLTKALTFYAESERYSELTSNAAAGLNPAYGLDSAVHSIGLTFRF